LTVAPANAFPVVWKNMAKNPDRSDNPAIATDGSGNHSVVWLDKASGRFQVLFAQSTSGGASFSRALRLSTTQSSVGTTPDIAVDSLGGLYAVWSESPDNTTDKSVIMFSRSLNGGVTFSAPSPISTCGSALGLSIAVDYLNNIHVIWLQQWTRGGEILHSRSLDGGAIFLESAAIRGTDGQTVHDDTSYNDRFPELEGDYILANSPFNLSDWRGDLLMMDKCWQFGVPPASNANFAYVQNMVYHLELTGLAGFGLANGSMLSSESGEVVNIRSSLEAAYA
jgi:hypothetical protein